VKTHTVTIQVTVEAPDLWTRNDARDELLGRKSTAALDYVWNNCRTLYGPSGTRITLQEVTCDDE
jgi:hypothetical protein